MGGGSRQGKTLPSTRASVITTSTQLFGCLGCAFVWLETIAVYLAREAIHGQSFGDSADRLPRCSACCLQCRLCAVLRCNAGFRACRQLPRLLELQLFWREVLVLTVCVVWVPEIAC